MRITLQAIIGYEPHFPGLSNPSARRSRTCLLVKKLVKYQNIQFMSKSTGETVEDVILFYGWRDTNGDGTAFLWDDRN